MSAPNRRAFWLDVRFLIGLVLVVASVAGVWLVITSARQTTPVLVAAHTVLPGETVTRDDVRVAEVALGQLADGYLPEGALSADDGAEAMVATRTIAEGELLHAASLADARTVSTTVVVVRSAVDVPSAVVAGTTVDLWVAPVDADGVLGKPRILVASAVVSAVDRADGFVGSRGQSVELIIPRADVAAALEALASESALSVVPAGATP